MFALALVVGVVGGFILMSVVSGIIRSIISLL